MLLLLSTGGHGGSAIQFLSVNLFLFVKIFSQRKVSTGRCREAMVGQCLTIYNEQPSCEQTYHLCRLPIVVHSVRNHHLWTIRHLCGVNPRCPSVPIQWPTVPTKQFVASIFGVPVWEGTASLISAPIIDHSDQLTGTRKC